MNWRALLKSDVSNLLHGGKEPPIRASWRGPVYLPRGRTWFARLNRRDSDLLLLTRQLSTIVSANADLVGGIESLIADAPKPKLKRVYRALVIDLSTGAALAASMRKRIRFFPAFYCDLVEAGERTGNLTQTFAQLIQHFEVKRRTNATVKGWLAYFTIVLILQAAVGAFLCIKVFPVYDEILTDFSTSISLFSLRTEWLFALLDVILAILAVSLVYRIARRGHVFRLVAGRVALSLPLCRTLLVRRNLAHASFVLERLLAAGVPLDRALEDAAGLDVNPLYRNAFRRLAARVVQGEALHHAMASEDRRLFPAMVSAAVLLGENSGSLPEAFGRVARLYNREVIKIARVAAQFLMPLGLALPVAISLFFALTCFGFNATIINAMIDQL